MYVADEDRRQWFVFGAQINAIRPDCRNHCASFSLSARMAAAHRQRPFKIFCRAELIDFSGLRMTPNRRVDSFQLIGLQSSSSHLAYGRFNLFSDSSAFARRLSVGWVKNVLIKWKHAPITYTPMSCLSPSITIKHRWIDKDALIIIVCKIIIRNETHILRKSIQIACNCNYLAMRLQPIAFIQKTIFAFRQLHVRHSAHIYGAVAHTQINGDKWPNVAACAQIRVINRSWMEENENCNSNKNKYTTLCVSIYEVFGWRRSMQCTKQITTESNCNLCSPINFQNWMPGSGLGDCEWRAQHTCI